MSVRQNAWFKKLKERQNMVTLRLDLPYDMRDGDAQSGFASPRMISDWIVRRTIEAKYPQGAKRGPEQRNIGRVLKSLAKAMTSEHDSIEISQEALEWLVKDVVSEWAPQPATYTHWYLDFADYLDELLAETKRPKSNGAEITPLREPARIEK